MPRSVSAAARRAATASGRCCQAQRGPKKRPPRRGPVASGARALSRSDAAVPCAGICCASSMRGASPVAPELPTSRAMLPVVPLAAKPAAGGRTSPVAAASPRAAMVAFMINLVLRLRMAARMAAARCPHSSVDVTACPETGDLCQNVSAPAPGNTSLQDSAEPAGRCGYKSKQARANGRLVGTAAMPANSPHILVVDDDPEIRKLLGRYMDGQGFRVSLAADRREFETRMATGRIDLVVLDVMLPDGSGLDICRELRGRRPEVPVILLTALKEDVDRIIGLEIGADDYLGKPFNPRELVARIRAVLRRADPHRPAE